MNPRLAYLYQRYIEDTCTKEEREEFLSMVAENVESNTLTGLMDGTWNEIGSDGMMFPGADSMFQDILSTHKKTTIKKISWQRYAAAVAAILIMISGGIFFYQKTSNHLPDIQVITADIQAGKNKATLTLANGTTINLDSIKDGEVAMQAGITITKTTDGQLVYNVIKSAEGEKQGSTETVYNTITTPRGGQYQVNLPDGSKIWLNAASSLKYPTVFSKNERKVQLTGEAYFEIAKVMIKKQGLKNKKQRMPFIVVTDKQEVEVLGTHFNLNSYTDEVETKTTLLEGAVRVWQRNSKKSVNLLPGQQSVLNNNNNLTTHEVDTEEVVAWKNGYFNFNESLESLMNKVSRWYDVEVVYEIKPEADPFIAKISRTKSLMALLKIIEQTGGVHFKIEGRRITVTK